MKNIKQFFAQFQIAYLLLGLLLGLSIGIGVIFVKAASPAESWATVSAGVSSGQTLTASLWNGLVNQVAALTTLTSSPPDLNACTCTGTCGSNSGTSACWTACGAGNSNYTHCGSICTPAGWSAPLAPCGGYY